MKDLFGNEVPLDAMVKKAGKAGRAAEIAHALLIGMHGAKEGEKCRNCAHLRHKWGRYTKCSVYGSDSGSRSTDWAGKWQACGKFEPKSSDVESGGCPDQIDHST